VTPIFLDRLSRQQVLKPNIKSPAYKPTSPQSHACCLSILHCHVRGQSLAKTISAMYQPLAQSGCLCACVSVYCSTCVCVSVCVKNQIFWCREALTPNFRCEQGKTAVPDDARNWKMLIVQDGSALRASTLVHPNGDWPRAPRAPAPRLTRFLHACWR
jgi:hypothetical protein